MDRTERRRSVRMRPLHELPATAVLLLDGRPLAALRVVDVSVGGLAIAPHAAIASSVIGTRLGLRLSLSHYGEHDVTVVVRWAADALVGAQYVDLTPAATTAVRRYVAELLERGAPS
ncbi:MAG: PilZ domain-containing protein [Deltaproteobacteria bacterium]